MKELAKMAALAAVLFAAPVFAQSLREVVLPTSATELTRTAGLNAWEVLNLGATNVWCAFTAATCVVNKSRKVPPGGTWTGTIPGVRLFCRSETDAQTTGAATIFSEGSTR